MRNGLKMHSTPDLYKQEINSSDGRAGYTRRFNAISKVSGGCNPPYHLCSQLLAGTPICVAIFILRSPKTQFLG